MSKLIKRPIECKLLLSGVETPFQAIQVVDVINQASRAEITVPYCVFGKFLRPRTLVLVFYRYKDVPDMEYRLFFKGEIVGRTEAKGHAERGLSFTCVSLGDYLNTGFVGQIRNNVQSSVIANSARLNDIGQRTASPVIRVKANVAGTDTFAVIASGGLESYIDNLLNELFQSDVSPAITLSKYETYRLREKFTTLPTDMITAFLGGLGDTDIKRQLLARFQELETVAEHLKTVRSFLLLDYIENRASVLAGNLHKPVLNYGVPPKCNVIFPCQVQSFRFTEDFAKMPTRLLFDIGQAIYAGTQQDTDASVFLDRKGISPKELAGFYQNNPDLTNESRIRNFMYYTAEESERGVIPYLAAEQALNTAWFHGLRRNPEDSGGYEEKVQQWQDFKLFYIRGQARRLQISDCAFLPDLLCGFPLVLLDNQTFLMGYLESVTHTITATGQASSRVTVSHVRDVLDPLLGRPWWLKDLAEGESAYSFDRVGDEIYDGFIGCNSIKRTEGEIEASKDTLPEELHRLFSKDMVGYLNPSDINDNWSDICNESDTSNALDCENLQYKIYTSLLTTFLEYEQTSSPANFAEAYNARRMTSFKDFVTTFKDVIKPSDEEAFLNGELCDLENVDEIPEVEVGLTKPRTVPLLFFRDTNTQIVKQYVNNLQKFMVDRTIYGVNLSVLEDIMFPSDIVGGEIRQLTTLPYKNEIYAAGGSIDTTTNTTKSITVNNDSPDRTNQQDSLGTRNSGAGKKLAPTASDMTINKPNGGKHPPVKNLDKYRVSGDYLEQRTGRKHAGIDFATPVGTPLYAVSDARVYRIRNNEKGYGWYVELEHLDSNGKGTGRGTLYAHMREKPTHIKVGDKLGAGSHLGYSGNTGRSQGPHLHFEYKKVGRYGSKNTYSPATWL